MESKRRTAPTKLAVKGHYNYKAPLDGAEMMAANPYRPWSARITSMTPLTEKETLFELRLIDDRIRDAFHHKPGQFVCVSVFGVGEVPISISSSPSKSGFIEICVRRAGDVTSALHNMQCGDIVGLRGPYGHPFPFEDMKGHDILLVAGGLGIAPLRSLINNIHDERSEFGNVTIIYGSRSPEEIMFRCHRADEIIPPRHLLDLPGALVLDEEDLGVSGERGGLWRACVRAGQAPARCGQRRGGRDFR